jgi:phosphohistidine phosphatase
MNLILWRHADAENGYPDAARALTPLGREQAGRMAAWLSTRLPGSVRILASPAVRARQTAAALTGSFETVPQIGVGASPRDLLLAAGWQCDDPPAQADCVVMVGHQPTLGRVAALLLTGEASDWPVAKGAVWWFSGGLEGTHLRASIDPDLT